MDRVAETVAVTGIPRSGTTWLFRSLAGLEPGSTVPKGRHYERLPFIKAHSLAPPDSFDDPRAEELAAHCKRRGKCLFLFGDPVESVISTRLRRWTAGHAVNCGYFDPLDTAAIYHEDCFNYERIFDSWMGREHPFPVLALRYETAGHHTKAIESFLGRKIRWNPWKARRRSNRRKVSRRELQAIESTYASLACKVCRTSEISTPGT